MAEIKGKGLPTKQTAGGLGDIYVDSTTGVKYKCTGAYTMVTHAGSTTEYEWKPANPVFKNLQRTAEEKPHDISKKPAKSKAKAAETKVEEKVEEVAVEEKIEEKVEEQPVAEQPKAKTKHNYGKYYEANKAE